MKFKDTFYGPANVCFSWVNVNFEWIFWLLFEIYGVEGTT